VSPPAVAVAAAICWLSRQRGLPGGALRWAVVQRHPTVCDWCDWPLDDLLQMARFDPVEGSRFGRLQTSEQRRLVDEAQGGVTWGEGAPATLPPTSTN
jgi:hypothetical protein